MTVPDTSATVNADLEQWLESVQVRNDLTALAVIIRSVLPGIPLACGCLDGTCDRCEMERIVETYAPSRKPQEVPHDGDDVPF